MASFLVLEHGVVPPVANYETPDPQLTLDIVSGEPRVHDGRPVLSNSFAFGGHNVSLVLGAAPDARLTT